MVEKIISYTQSVDKPVYNSIFLPLFGLNLAENIALFHLLILLLISLFIILSSSWYFIPIFLILFIELKNMAKIVL